MLMTWLGHFCLSLVLYYDPSVVDSHEADVHSDLANAVAAMDRPSNTIRRFPNVLRILADPKVVVVV